jgi:hypothetical protein
MLNHLENESSLVALVAMPQVNLGTLFHFHSVPKKMYKLGSYVTSSKEFFAMG